MISFSFNQEKKYRLNARLFREWSSSFIIDPTFENIKIFDSLGEEAAEYATVALNRFLIGGVEDAQVPLPYPADLFDMQPKPRKYPNKERVMLICYYAGILAEYIGLDKMARVLALKMVAYVNNHRITISALINACRVSKFINDQLHGFIYNRVLINFYKSIFLSCGYEYCHSLEYYQNHYLVHIKDLPRNFYQTVLLPAFGRRYGHNLVPVPGPVPIQRRFRPY